MRGRVHRRGEGHAPVAHDAPLEVLALDRQRRLPLPQVRRGRRVGDGRRLRRRREDRRGDLRHLAHERRAPEGGRVLVDVLFETLAIVRNRGLPREREKQVKACPGEPRLRSQHATRETDAHLVKLVVVHCAHVRGHGDCLEDGVRYLLAVPWVHDDRPVQTLRRARKLAQHEHTLLRLLARDVFI